MAKDLRQLPAYLGDDATFRTWGLGLAAQLAAIGLVQTADTGQINWTTVVRPAANAFAGYEIWRFADAVQATAPVFLKIEYGAGSTQDKPSLALTVGSSTNGAGTLTGQVNTRQFRVQGNSKTAGQTLPSYVSGSGGDALRLMTSFDNAQAGHFMMFVVERSRDGAGAATANGVWVCVLAASSFNHGVVPAAGAVPAMSAAQAALSQLDITAGANITVSGSDVALSPFWAVIGRMYPLLGIVGYRHADIGAGVTFTGDWLGVTRTWFPFGTVGGPQGVVTAIGWAFLWE